ncbi:hypothetical protein [Persicirhabdus sediminis]|uniref:PEP-CTERM protein-sorting domain-containing protein n=1 Tax=Persicirhabdus sediminis TaxID=454144 RepID=A0A8J7SJT0_9BACT|nr:hypothetical protein [Persicirhabdus sediminis]MBK1792360.1 hypothetical protein [Persicirhabdus sediminis]
MKLIPYSICLSLLGIQLSPAAIVWPSSDDGWIAVTDSNGDYYGDPDDINPASLNMIGDEDTPMLFWQYQHMDSAEMEDDQIIFRLRVEDIAKNPQFTWQILFNTKSETGIDFVLELNLSGSSDGIYLAQTLTDGPNFDDVTFDTSTPIEGQEGGYLWFTTVVLDEGEPGYEDYSRFVATGDGNYFVDIGMSWDAFSTATGLSLTDEFSIGASTSATHTSINKDVPLGLANTAGVNSGFGSSINGIIPEPSASALISFALCGFILYRKK